MWPKNYTYGFTSWPACRTLCADYYDMSHYMWRDKISSKFEIDFGKDQPRATSCVIQNVITQRLPNFRWDRSLVSSDTLLLTSWNLVSSVVAAGGFLKLHEVWKTHTRGQSHNASSIQNVKLEEDIVLRDKGDDVTIISPVPFKNWLTKRAWICDPFDTNTTSQIAGWRLQTKRSPRSLKSKN